MDWQAFLSQHAEALKESPYETLFVRRVLSQVAQLSPEVVVPQQPFRDTSGQARRIDFAIVEGEHVKIAIEVDGWDKTGRGSGMSREEFDDFLHRESSLSSQGWTVLRYSNRQVQRVPAKCARQIELTLTSVRERARSFASVTTGALSLATAEQAEANEAEQELNRLNDELENEIARFHWERRETVRMWWTAAAVAVVLFIGVFAVVAKARVSTSSGIDSRGLAASGSCNNSISWQKAKQYEGQTVSVRGPVAKVRSSGDGIYLNVGNDYPHQEFVFEVRPASLQAGQAFEQHDACATGRVRVVKGVPRITVSGIDQILLLSK